MTHPVEPTGPEFAAPPPPVPRPPWTPGRRTRALAVAAAAMVVVGAGAGVGMAATSGNTGSSMSGMGGDPAATGSPSAGHGAANGSGGHGMKGNGSKGKNGKGKGAAHVDPARQAWSHKYGVDRSTMPNLAPTATATAQQKAAATDLLTRTEAATAKYRDLSVAKAAGYDLQASLTRKEKQTPGLTARLKRIDAGPQVTGADMPMLHVGNQSLKDDGKVLDPNAPETLMYGYQGDGKWMLMGVMYIANETYPQAPPDPGGPITRWHYHDKSGARGLMMHLFFVPGNDLSRAYAAEMT